MADIKISQLTTGTPKGTDLTPATDTTDTSSAASGTTKKYIRSSEFNYVLTGLGYTTKTAVRLAGTVALTATYANGASGVGATLTNAGAQVALSLDGVAVALSDRVLIKDQASAFQNGVYTVSNIGSGATNWVLTRATDYDQAADIAQGDTFLVNFGSTYAGRALQQTASGPFTMGTTSITFSLLSTTTSPAGFMWNSVTGTSQAMSGNNGYITNNAGLVTITLPASSSVGQEIKVAGQGAGGWLIAQNASQLIHVGSSATTTGVAGSLASTNRYDSLQMVCITANTEWSVVGGPQGAITVA